MRNENLQELKTVKTKYINSFIALTAAKVNLELRKSNALMHTLGELQMFRQAKTGDEEFDDFFTVITNRDDVLRILQSSPELRRSLLNLARESQRFFALTYKKNSLTLRLTPHSFSKKGVEESARAIFTAELPGLVAAFAKLPTDTPQQARNRHIDQCVPSFPALTLLLLEIAGLFGASAIPIASGNVPWSFILSAAFAFLVLHVVVLFTATKQGLRRIQGISRITMLTVMFVFLCSPELVVAINVHGQQRMTSETVEVAKLLKVERQKSATRYFIVLAKPPSQLVTGDSVEDASLEISFSLYWQLQHQQIQQGSRLKIDEATGMLGLPFVVNATPV